MVLSMSGECGYIDKTGREVIAPKYDDAISFQDGLAPVKLNRRWGYIDKTGREVITPKYEYCGNFQKGLAPVQQNGKWGYIDKSGSVIIPFHYNGTNKFKDGKAKVWDDGGEFYIDKTGKRFDGTEFKNFDRVGERHPEFVPRGTNFCGPMDGFVKIFDSRSVKIDVYAW